MPLENDFLPFAAGTGANVLTQAQYTALSALANGFASGIAPSVQLNKVWRQASIVAAVVAQFIVDASGQPAIDDGTTATLEANLFSAIRSAVKQFVILTDTGAPNTYAAANTPALTALVNGLTQNVTIGHANTGASTYAPDALAAKPIFGLGGVALQGGELVAGSIATLMYSTAANSGVGAWILLECAGGALPVGAAIASGHALNFGQFPSSLAGNGYQKLPNGLLIQWGSVLGSSMGPGVSVVLSFPVAFTTAVYSIALAPDVVIGTNTTSWFSATARSVTGFSYTQAPGTDFISKSAYTWIAIGK